MDCHRCQFLKYDGCRYGRCSHPDHPDVMFVFKSKRGPDSKRPYSRDVCREFRLRKKCSNCKHWVRGEYYADGRTPAKRGHCSFKVIERGPDCPLWEIGPTSWKKRDKNKK